MTSTVHRATSIDLFKVEWSTKNHTQGLLVEPLQSIDSFTTVGHDYIRINNKGN